MNFGSFKNDVTDKLLVYKLYICIYIYIYTYQTIGIMLECSPMVWKTGVQSQVESYQRLKKWYLMPPCLTQHYKVQIKGKWSYPGKGVAPSLTPQCTSSWKGNFLVALTVVSQLLIYIYIKTRFGIK